LEELPPGYQNGTDRDLTCGKFQPVKTCFYICPVKSGQEIPKIPAFDNPLFFKTPANRPGTFAAPDLKG
jgi:hypothetical protein